MNPTLKSDSVSSLKMTNKVASTTRSRPVVLSAILAFVLTGYPPVQTALMGGIPAITSLFAADAFYYLSVAVHSTVGRYSFDGNLPTNGFHPLWQMLLQLVVSHVGRGGPGPIIASFAMSLFFTALGFTFIAVVLARITGAAWPALLLFPGPYFYLASQIDPRLGSSWGSVNGMESCLSLFFFGILLLLLFRSGYSSKPLTLVVLGCVSLLVVLSRLDDIFLVITLGAGLIEVERRRSGRPFPVKRLVTYLAPIVLGLTCYLTFNWLTVGVLMPTSGASKSDGLALVKNLAWAILVAVPSSGKVLSHMVSSIPKQVLGLSVTWRFAQVILPMMFAAWLLMRRDLLTWIAEEHTPVFVSLLYYVVFKGAYNILFVPLWNQGHWYYPVSILVVNMTAILAITRFAQTRPLFRTVWPWPVAGPCLAAAWFAAIVLVWRLQSTTFQATTNIQMLSQASAINAELTNHVGSYKIIEFDDGILNYALGSPTLSGFGLASDAATAAALKKGTLLSHAAKSGYNLIASANYVLLDRTELSSDQIRKELLDLSYFKHEHDMDEFVYSVAYVDPVSHATFIQFTKKP